MIASMAGGLVSLGLQVKPNSGAGEFFSFTSTRHPANIQESLPRKAHILALGVADMREAGVRSTMRIKSVFVVAMVFGVAAAMSPAEARKKPKIPQIQQVRTFALSAQERAGILPLQTAIEANNYAAAAAVLPAAQSAAQSADARYFVAQYQLRLGISTGNSQMQSQAIDAMIASGGAPAADIPQLYANQAALAAGFGDLRKAEAAFTRLAELVPGDPKMFIEFAEIKNDLGKIEESAALMNRAITLHEASGQPAPEGWYKRAVKIAYDAKLPLPSLQLSRALVAAYPSKENWRDAMFIHRELAGLDKGGALDLLRLKRASMSLLGERDYLEFVSTFNNEGLPLEAKAALDEGVARHMIDPAKPSFKEFVVRFSKRAAADKMALSALRAKAVAAPAGVAAMSAGDAFYGAGEYIEAAEFYRAALQKGAVDVNMANTRLGMALALAGRKVEAEAAFHNVAGARSILASLWLTWLARRA
jgi:tetratricopeptide (TPR) repeat protein